MGAEQPLLRLSCLSSDPSLAISCAIFGNPIICLPSPSLFLFSSPLPALVCLAGETIYSSLERRILAWTIGAYSLELLSSTSSSSPDSSDHVLHSPTSFPFCAIVCNRAREGEVKGESGRIAQGAADENDDDDEPD